MEKLLDKLEFGNVKLLRKNLMVASATGIVVSQLVKYSSGDITFFGFTIPASNTALLNKLMWFIILYFIFALLVRYFDEEFVKYYKKNIDLLALYNSLVYKPTSQTSIDQDNFRQKMEPIENLRKVVLIIFDLVIPIVLGIVALVFCYSF